MTRLVSSETSEIIVESAILPTLNFEGRQVQIDVRAEDNVLTYLYYVDKIEDDNVYLTTQKIYLNGVQRLP